MSLRVRLNFLITLLFISLFILSSFYIIANARDAVHKEVQSTANFALQLIQIANTSASVDEESQLMLLQELSELDETRHLHIELANPTEVLVPDEKDFSLKSKAPKWFVDLVTPPPTEIRRWLYNPIIPPTGIIIRADPIDEIDENWYEVRGTLVFLLVFIIMANILVYITIGRYLSPIDTILDGLSGIEKGNYELELPHFRLPELERISQRFNEMVRVLKKSKSENQSLTQRSLEIQEEERRHLSQELHDELGQTITAIKAVAVAISNKKNSDNEEINTNLKTIVDYSDHIYQVAKNMMHRLRPSLLDEFGLIKALQNMIDDWNSRQDKIFCHFSFSNIPDNLSESLRINIYRIIQESLTNALKHSCANEISISINCQNNSNEKKLFLLIKDDGVGFNKENMKSGLGLLGMKERVEMHNGKFEFISAINQGVQINISLPVKTEMENQNEQ